MASAHHKRHRKLPAWNGCLLTSTCLALFLPPGPLIASEAKILLGSQVEMLTLETNGKQKPGELHLIGKAWEKYSRGLVRFDLTSLASIAKSHERVARATLTFQAAVISNPGALPLEVGAPSEEWNMDSSYDKNSGDKPWPGKTPNIDGIVPKNEFVRVDLPSEGGQVEVDVARLVDAWLLQGKPNNGLLIRMGPAIYGKPDAGNWDVTLAEPTLSVEFAGEPPTLASEQARTLRFYPSALLAPIRSPYIFHVFNGGQTDHSARMINSFGRTANPGRGELPLQWHFGPNNPYLKTREQFVTQYLAATRQAMGIEVDEWQGPTRAGKSISDTEDPNRVESDAKIDYSIAGILAAKAATPSFYVLVYWRGEDSIKPLTSKGLPDLLVVEAQEFLEKQFPLDWGISQGAAMERIAFAKELGMIEKTVPLIGMFHAKDRYHPGKILDIDTVERWIKEYRAKYPEMPGIVLYGGKGGEDLIRQTEALLYKYYVDPAPELRIERPAFDEVLNFPRIECQVNATGKDGRSIQRYDWFVDNRLVAQTADARWILDKRGLKDGLHLLTVHAIDEAWNRTSAQIPFQIPARSE